jgi:hypothetical protein
MPRGKSQRPQRTKNTVAPFVHPPKIPAVFVRDTTKYNETIGASLVAEVFHKFPTVLTTESTPVAT